MKKRSLMKRCVALLLAGMMLVGTTACSNGKTETSSEGGSKKLDKLTVYFVPSRDPD